jgi:hypothetical protein
VYVDNTRKEALISLNYKYLYKNLALFERKYCEGFMAECNTVEFGEAYITLNYVPPTRNQN